MIRIACSDSEASCLIASLITEIAMPCPCEGGPLRICGTGPDGAPAEVRGAGLPAVLRHYGQRLRKNM